MRSASFHVVGLSVSVALAAWAAGLSPMVPASVATARWSPAGKQRPFMGAAR
jgi:hypothetical protein